MQRLQQLPGDGKTATKGSIKDSNDGGIETDDDINRWSRDIESQRGGRMHDPRTTDSNQTDCRKTGQNEPN